MKPSRAEVLEWVQGRLGQALTPAAQADVLSATGCDGEEAAALTDAFAARFAVDMRAYRPEMHHHSAGHLLRPGWPFPLPGVRVPLSVSLLHQAAVEGRWPVAYPDLPPERDLSLANLPLLLCGLTGATLLVLWAVPRLF